MLLAEDILCCVLTNDQELTVMCRDMGVITNTGDPSGGHKMTGL